MAAEGGRIDVLECLSEISIDLLAKLDSDGCLPLHVAAQSPSPKAAAAAAGSNSSGAAHQLKLFAPAAVEPTR